MQRKQAKELKLSGSLGWTQSQCQEGKQGQKMGQKRRELPPISEDSNF